MKTFKDTEYGDLTGETCKGDVLVPTNVESLVGSPKIVDGSFNCNSCRLLESLKHSPKIIKGDFSCSWCAKLETLKGAPVVVEGSFECTHCKNLETLEGAPRKCKEFICAGCKKIKTLDPLLQCKIEEVVADAHLLAEYNKKKKVVDKYGYDKAKEVFDMLDDLL